METGTLSLGRLSSLSSRCGGVSSGLTVSL